MPGRSGRLVKRRHRFESSDCLVMKVKRCAALNMIKSGMKDKIGCTGVRLHEASTLLRQQTDLSPRLAKLTHRNKNLALELELFKVIETIVLGELT